MRFHRIKSPRGPVMTGAVALAAAAGLVGLVGPASAADPTKPGPTVQESTRSAEKPASSVGKNGVCEVNELCLYYLQDRRGAFLDLFSSDSDFSNDLLRGGGSGNLSNANNNTRSFLSRESSVYWRVYDGVNFTGTEILCIAPGDRANFTRTLWDRASSATYNTTPC